MSLLTTINKAASELPEVEITVKQWKCKVTLRRLSIAERISMFDRVSDEEKKTNAASLLVAYSLVDNGVKLHVTEGLDEVYKGLQQGDPEAVNFLYEKCEELSAITQSSVDELEKN